MATIPYQGKDLNHISVGKSKGFDYQTVQAALDRVATLGDNTEDNPYLITVAPAVYDEQVIVGGAHSFVTLKGESRSGSVIRWTAAPAMQISGSPKVEHFMLDSLRIIGRNAALAQGVVFGGLSAADSSLTWDHCAVFNCMIASKNGGLVVHGITSGSGDDPPRLAVKDNIIEGRQAAYIVGGNVRLASQSNVIRAKGTFSAPYFGSDTVGPFKQTGITIETNQISGASSKAKAFMDFSGELIFVIGDEVGGAPGQRRVCGVNAVGTAAGGILQVPVRLVAPTIHAEYQDTAAGVISDGFAGILISDGDYPEDRIIVSGGSIFLRQASGVSAAATELIGIHANSSLGAFIKAYGTAIHCRDDNATATLTSLKASSPNNIEAAVMSDHATSGAAIAAAVTKP